MAAGRTRSIAHAVRGHHLLQISLALFHPGSFKKKKTTQQLNRLYQRLHQIPIVLGAPHNPNGFKRKLLPADSRSGCQLPDVWLLLSITGIIFAEKLKRFDPAEQDAPWINSSQKAFWKDVYMDGNFVLVG